jgi:hypothetical protein
MPSSPPSSSTSAADLPALVHALPKDAAGFRSLCETLETLEDEVGPHLDAFSSTAPDSVTELDRATLIDLFRHRRRDLELAILVSSTRLRAVPVRSIYVGGLLAKFCDDALGRRKSKPLGRLLSRIELRERAAWGRVVASLRALSDATKGWREWPSPELAREAVDALAAIEGPWTTLVDELKRENSGGVNRERRRDPAFRRAIHWHQLALGILRRLAVPGGPLRITIDYCFAVLAYFDTAVVNAPRHGAVNRAASDLLILEVFGMLEQYSLTDGELDADVPRFLEQGATKRRKRIQRARLQVLLRWTSQIDDLAWIEWVFPALDRLSRGSNQLTRLCHEGRPGQGQDPNQADPAVTTPGQVEAPEPKPGEAGPTAPSPALDPAEPLDASLLDAGSLDPGAGGSLAPC